MKNKYYYGIDTCNGLSYCIESELKDVREFINTWLGKEWYQFDYKSNWAYNKDTDNVIEFNSAIVRVKDIVSVYCNVERIEDEEI